MELENPVLFAYGLASSNNSDGFDHISNLSAVAQKAKETENKRRT
jgi:hypothetical protein